MINQGVFGQTDRKRSGTRTHESISPTPSTASSAEVGMREKNKKKIPLVISSLGEVP